MNQQEPVEPEAQTDAERRNPPEPELFGHRVNETDVALSSGDGRDWFPLDQRLAALHKAMNIHRAACRSAGCLCHFTGTGAVDSDRP